MEERIMENLEAAPEPKLPKGMAITALALAIPGLLIPCLGIVAFILGIVVLVRASAGRAAGNGMAIAGIVVGAIGTLSSFFVMCTAIAIPSMMTARRSSFEVNGMCCLRACATAQTMYIKTDWDGNGKKEYAFPFTNLYQDASCGGKEHKLIDRGFADAAGPAGAPKMGYLFQDCKTIGGKPIDRTKDYALCAKPAVYGRTGCRTFIVSTDGMVWGKDLGSGATFVDDFPADPKAAGWSEAD
jgi:hypothetical protein